MKKCNTCQFYLDYICSIGYDVGNCGDTVFKEKEVIERLEEYYMSKAEMKKRNYYVEED